MHLLHVAMYCRSSRSAQGMSHSVLPFPSFLPSFVPSQSSPSILSHSQDKTNIRPHPFQKAHVYTKGIAMKGIHDG